ncbi:MAG: sigma-70 family RNA polymerase sigma factor [Planctomycetaceae bacterium]|nr:sigma-70 family RNA polymerase sigma factor [Planctomycetaceae bacterium]
MSDEELIRLSLSGDRTAYEKLVLKYQDRLFNTMVHVSGNSEDALDVVQEAFLQAYLRLSTFRQTSQFYTWLYRIAFNLSLGIRRKRKPIASGDGISAEYGSELVGDTASPLEKVGNDEMAQILWNAIDRLHEDYRSVIVLREIESCSYEEISQILDLPAGTVRSRLHRARNVLKESLQRYERDF